MNLLSSRQAPAPISPLMSESGDCSHRQYSGEKIITRLKFRSAACHLALPAEPGPKDLALGGAAPCESACLTDARQESF